MGFQKIYNWGMLAITIALGTLLAMTKGCNQQTLPKDRIDYGEKKDSVVVKSDTIFYPVYMDRPVPEYVYIMHPDSLKSHKKKNRVLDSLIKINMAQSIPDSLIGFLVSIYKDSLEQGNVKVVRNDTVQGKILSRGIKITEYKNDTSHYISQTNTVDHFIPVTKDKSPFDFGAQGGIYLTPMGVLPGLGIGVEFNPVTAIGNLFKNMFKKKPLK